MQPGSKNGADDGISMEAMKRHLDRVYIGYRPGDVTASVPPATMPPPSVEPSGPLKTIDLRQMTMAQLMAEAATTQAQDVWSGLLPDPPGVPVGRIAYVTGQQPRIEEGQQQQQQGQQQQAQQQQPRQQQGAAPAAAAAAQAASQKLSEQEIAAVLSRYLGPHSSRRGPIPWSELGLGKGGPRMGGVECDLRRLWQLAHSELGGFQAVEAAKRWPLVAQKMGAPPNTNFNLVRQWYLRFLLPLERQLQQQGGGGKAAARAPATGGDAEMEDAGPAVP